MLLNLCFNSWDSSKFDCYNLYSNFSNSIFLFLFFSVSRSVQLAILPVKIIYYFFILKFKIYILYSFLFFIGKVTLFFNYEGEGYFF